MDGPQNELRMPGEADGTGRDDRERDFWGHQIPSLDACLDMYRSGPDPNTDAMLRAVEPVAGSRILDFACGGGVTSAWLSARGADVVGVDLSPESVARAREVVQALGLRATFVTSLEDADESGPFDAVVGRYALHHTDVPQMSRLLAARVRPGGRGAFVETFATNPVLRFARGSIVGRLGVRKLGTEDERPLGRQDVAALELAFGEVEVSSARMHFLRLLDRQILQYRYRAASTAFGWIDDCIGALPRTTQLSYFQVVIVRKTRR